MLRNTLCSLLFLLKKKKMYNSFVRVMTDGENVALCRLSAPEGDYDEGSWNRVKRPEVCERSGRYKLPETGMSSNPDTKRTSLFLFFPSVL